MNSMTTEQTPIFDAVVAHVGDPVKNPAVDRSYTAIVKEAEAARANAPAEKATVPAPAARKPIAAAVARKTAS